MAAVWALELSVQSCGLALVDLYKVAAVGLQLYFVDQAVVGGSLINLSNVQSSECELMDDTASLPECYRVRSVVGRDLSICFRSRNLSVLGLASLTCE